MPFEREVTRHLFYLSADGAYSALEYHEDADPLKPAEGVTVLRSRFDQWLAGRAESAGARIIASAVARDMVWADSRCAGVKLEPGGTIKAAVVILAEGVNGFLTQAAGLGPKLKADQVSLGIKQTLRLSEDIIDQRFQVWGGRGAACFFIGSPLGRRPGGGFLYTNRKTISLGLVVPLAQIGQSTTNATDLLAAFQDSFPIRDLIRDAVPVEYAAHLIPSAGLKMQPKLVGPGILVAGDAAGFVVNAGFRIRGGDLAVASGLAAARAATAALKNSAVNQAALDSYPYYLKVMGVSREMERYRRFPEILKNPRWYDNYPDAAREILGNLIAGGHVVEPRLGSIVRQTLRSRIGWRNLITDLQRLLRFG